MKRKADAETEVRPRSKKVAQVEESEEEDEKRQGKRPTKARYVEPFPEAGAAEDVGEAGSIQETHMSWNEVEIPEDEESIDEEGDMEAWTKTLQDMCRKLKPEIGRGQKNDKIGVVGLLQRIRSAMRSGDWTSITAALWIPKTRDVTSVVKQLSALELLKLTKGMVERYEYPRERLNCERWIVQIMDDGAYEIVDSEPFRAQMRSLVNVLTQELRPADFAGKVNLCTGKWRQIQKLSEAYHAQHSAKDVTNRAAETGPPEDDDEGDVDGDEDGEDEDDEEDAD